MCASMHNTTNTEPPDIRVDDNKAVPLRMVALATAGLHPRQFGKTRAGLKLEKRLGPGVVAPPRRASLLGASRESNEGKEPELMEVNDVKPPTEGTRSPKSPPLTGSTLSESSPRLIFPSNRMVEVSPPRKTAYFIKI